MIAEENLQIKQLPNLSISHTKINHLIMSLMKEVIPNFIAYLNSDYFNKRKLNEDSLSQVFLEQAQLLIRHHDYPFNINCQYQDLYYQSKGFSDLYFYPNEQNASTKSLFSFESKRIPPPEKKREKEYVVGLTNNGGIERYKTEMHGKGLKECGLLGFVEKNDFEYWLPIMNGWIEDLASTTSDWKEDEVMVKLESATNYSIFESLAYRENDVIKLIHLWVMVN